MQELHGWRAGRLQNVTLALASRTLALKLARDSRMEGGPFSTCGCRLSAARTRLRFKSLLQLQGLS
eukprot:5541197-Pyramimonas_sp.AAC.1